MPKDKIFLMSYELPLYRNGGGVNAGGPLNVRGGPSCQLNSSIVEMFHHFEPTVHS
jgi:hypothetical protein